MLNQFKEKKYQKNRYQTEKESRNYHYGKEESPTKTAFGTFKNIMHTINLPHCLLAFGFCKGEISLQISCWLSYAGFSAKAHHHHDSYPCWFVWISLSSNLFLSCSLVFFHVEPHSSWIVFLRVLQVWNFLKILSNVRVLVLDQQLSLVSPCESSKQIWSWGWCYILVLIGSKLVFVFFD